MRKNLTPMAEAFLELIQETNATIENTIRQIKQAKADKEKTKAIRRSLEEKKSALNDKPQEVKPKNESQMKKKKALIGNDTISLALAKLIAARIEAKAEEIQESLSGERTEFSISEEEKKQ